MKSYFTIKSTGVCQEALLVPLKKELYGGHQIKFFSHFAPAGSRIRLRTHLAFCCFFFLYYTLYNIVFNTVFQGKRYKELNNRNFSGLSGRGCDNKFTRFLFISGNGREVTIV